MGAINFSLDRHLVRELKKSLSLNYFVETGTFKGDTIAHVKSLFDKFISVELSHEYYEFAKSRFKDDSNIKIMFGDSKELLSEVVKNVRDKSVLYWLDAHWCVADATAGEISQCPLVDEILSINHLNERSVVIIDDARLFLAPPPEPHETSQWPDINKILSALNRISGNHSLMVVNDCIVFYPNSSSPSMRKYAIQHGTDILKILENAHRKEQDYDVLLKQLKDKESEIEDLERETKEKDIEIEDMERETKGKDLEIEEMERETKGKDHEIEALKIICDERLDLINAQHALISKFNDEIKWKRFSKWFINRLSNYKDVVYLWPGKIRKSKYISSSIVQWDFKKSVRNYFMPKLGVLEQHPPVPIILPIKYYRSKILSTYPTVSIVTPSLNQGEFIERTINSIIDQNYPSLEHIIQDGGSTDNTVRILEQYSDKLMHWESRVDEGQTHAINAGFKHATGSIMAYLNSDDIILPGALNYVVDYFNRHSDIDVVYGHRILIDNNDQQIGQWIMPPHNNKVLSWADFIPQETMFWRRRLWDKIGSSLDESFKFAMDWDLILRFRDAGAKFVRLPRFIGAFRIHPNQKTSVEIQVAGMEEMDRLRERCHGRKVSQNEINIGVARYLSKHIVLDKLQSVLRY